jgi:CHAT domain-containing protein
VDSSASIAAVEAALPSARIVYLTLHGLASSDTLEPDHVSIALAPSRGENGFLSSANILGMPTDLRASLIVIAACRSALGPIRPAEGVIGLQRAFLARGAKTVVAGQWDLYEQPTAELLNGFFRHWLLDPDRPTKAESLRRATAGIVRASPWRHPRYWAGLKLMS